MYDKEMIKEMKDTKCIDFVRDRIHLLRRRDIEENKEV